MSRKDLVWLRTLLAARTTPEGTPKKGFAANVEMLKREIARITDGTDGPPPA